MLKLPILILFFIAANAFANNLNDYYQEGLAAAHANMHKPKEQIANYNPEEKFTNYNDKPSQMSYYHGVKSYKTEELQTAGAAAAIYNEQDDQNNAVQTAKKSLQKNPKERINPADPWLSRSGSIMSNAADLALGISSNNNEGVKYGTKAGVNCQEAKTCRIDLIKKICNEETGPLKKVCEKIPQIKVTVQEVLYPNCEAFVTTNGYNSCPAGYTQILHQPTYVGDSNSDIRFCTKRVNSTTEVTECYGGKYAFQGSDWRNTGNWKFAMATVPRNRHAHLKSFRGIRNWEMLLSVINKTTGQTLYYDKNISGHGQIIDLPFSETQDQTFEFYLGYNDHRCGGRVCGSGTGAAVLFFDHAEKTKVASLESWQEVNCSAS